MKRHRTGPLVALAAGIALVFAGLSSALGYSITGMTASLAAIAALLYAGAVWFGAAPASPDLDVIVFTRDLIAASGPSAGRPIADLFPGASRAAIDEHCRLALDGHATRLTVAPGVVVLLSPVRSPEGAIVCGVLLSGAAAEAAARELITTAV